MSRKKPKPGDLVAVVWEDIAGTEGHRLETPVFRTPGFWVGTVEADGREYIVTERSQIVTGDDDFAKGLDRYPAAVVLRVEVL